MFLINLPSNIQIVGPRAHGFCTVAGCHVLRIIRFFLQYSKLGILYHSVIVRPL